MKTTTKQRAKGQGQEQKRRGSWRMFQRLSGWRYLTQSSRRLNPRSFNAVFPPALKIAGLASAGREQSGPFFRVTGERRHPRAVPLCHLGVPNPSCVLSAVTISCSSATTLPPHSAPPPPTPNLVSRDSVMGDGGCSFLFLCLCVCLCLSLPPPPLALEGLRKGHTLLLSFCLCLCVCLHPPTPPTPVL